MGSLVWSLLFPVFLWWFSTGLVLAAVSRGPRTRIWVLLASTLALVWALWTLAEGRADATAGGASLAFVAAVVVWGWHEVTFLLGYLTGPRREPCPPEARGWRRFWLASQAMLSHEVAIAVTGIGLFVLVWDQPNQVGAWTFLVLWSMRLSAKLNIFFGVPSFDDAFLPSQLTYLKSYFGRTRMNGLFPISVTIGTLLGAWLVHEAWGTPPGGFAQAAYLLPAALVFLAVLEHWFLVLPIADTALWRWWLALRAPATEDRAADEHRPEPRGKLGVDRAVFGPGMATASLVSRPGAVGGQS